MEPRGVQHKMVSAGQERRWGRPGGCPSPLLALLGWFGALLVLLGGCRF